MAAIRDNFQHTYTPSLICTPRSTVCSPAPRKDTDRNPRQLSPPNSEEMSRTASLSSFLSPSDPRGQFQHLYRPISGWGGGGQGSSGPLRCLALAGGTSLHSSLGELTPSPTLSTVAVDNAEHPLARPTQEKYALNYYIPVSHNVNRIRGKLDGGWVLRCAWTARRAKSYPPMGWGFGACGEDPTHRWD